MHITIIGAGVFGAWCAKFLADRGHRITLVEAYGPANGRASSSDYSRVIRAGYGGDATYSRWALQSLDDWQALAALSGQSLLARTGALFMGRPGDAYVQSTYATLRALDCPAELLDTADLRARFPQMAHGDLGACVFEPGAGVIRARAAVQALVGYLVAHAGVSYVTGRVQPVADRMPALLVRTSDGARLDADAFVFACGPWLPRMFAEAVGGRIRPTRQEVLYYGVPAGDPMFSVARLPVWIDFTAGLYGIPDLDACGFKVGIDAHGPLIDPDTLDRTVDAGLVARTRAWLGQRFPALHDAPLVDAHVCQYENTSSGDFIIDRHPRFATCWIVGGGSGHGFKHGPAVGRHVADLITGRAEVQPRFALAGKSGTSARSVY